MKRSGFIAIGSSATRSHHSFSMGSCALPSLFLLVLSVLRCGTGAAQRGSSAALSTWSDGNGSWDVAGNWTSGPPNASTNACILDGREHACYRPLTNQPQSSEESR
jgi:hypothetical protein